MKLTDSQKHLYSQYLAVTLIAVQFSFDTCVYLSSVVQYVKECGSDDPENYLFILQAVSAAVQVFFSFIIGDIASYVGSIKWVIIFLYFLSFVGNFLYSCAGAVSLNTLLGGRIICGAASSSGAVVYSYITAISKDRTTIFKLFSIYRTSAGICMALAQLVAILFALCDFTVRGYRITSYNAPTFASSFIILLICVLLMFVLENPPVKSARNPKNYLDAWKKFFSAGSNRLIASLILLWNMFLSTFFMCEVLYFMPIFLTLNVGWKTEYEGVAFMVSAVLGVAGSFFAPDLVKLFAKLNTPSTQDETDTSDNDKIEKEESEQKSDINTLHRNQVSLTIFALFVALIGQAFMIGASEALSNDKLPKTNSGIFFTAGLSITMLGYNFMGSSVPALFSMYIDPQVKVQLMPFIGAIAGVGKLVAPIVLAALYKTPLGLPIGVGFGMILVGISIPSLVYLRRNKM
ncbi:Pul3p [Kluyveromyces lactis]|uniref:MFS-type transporter PUL3 n=1 Tax=Kluyveromyces lactis (strain ATCC 8585 / CBS 2359 / DSM 70799 / NBRC 1267 / NRRL Y-1140 / WM37) TaxID=284590 RepID=PUL3_KLULA|nr:uncharacterized protein KLLA0_C19250g [Kluyveromyces lactis]Q6CSN0.1 RecName: Full=MFS-type transporter PUL3; AltName: Full=Pulcherrimin biosynthesis cluster protein 3 [Kluyveromyces lactis NRRL Y-1140]CAH01910.1 KLLA0C19250p [Kluyveromyces lactis]|eukprot:XP_453059.1 uncharacterized protein KLLA0_C19250g [Kluyveromyces lactis]